MKISTTIDYKPTADAFGLSEKQTPYAAAIALTRLAGDMRDEIRKQMPDVFARVADFTLRGVYIRSASKSNLMAEVYFPESAEQEGRGSREYIRPGAEGATRRAQKKSEYLLTRMGALPVGWVTVPGKGMPTVGNGNLGPVYRQIINVLQIRRDAKPVSGRSQKGAARLGVAALFFVVQPGANTKGKNGGWLPPGVWKHLPGGQIVQMLKFVKKASYKKRLDVKAIAADVLSKQLPTRWREAAGIIKERFSKPK
jgi:hypothetical protein